MILSKSNIEIASQFFLGNPVPLSEKDSDYQNLFLSYSTDNNSSTLRELVTLHLLGYEPNHAKHGGDGIDSTTGKIKEVKPKYLQEGKKVSNTGNFNDMTIPLLESKKELDIVCSLFCSDRLIYLIEFPISIIYDVLLKPVLNAKAGKRVVCQFNYKNYDKDELKVFYFDYELAKHRNCLPKPHYEMLKSRYDAT